MVHVLIVSAEPRLVEALKAHLDDVAVRAVRDATSAQNELFQARFDLVFLDFEAIRDEPFETFVAIENVLSKERSRGVLLVRKASEAAQKLAEQLTPIDVVVDMSLGRPQFDDAVRTVKAEAQEAASGFGDDISTDRLVRVEVDLPAVDEGDLLETNLARLLYTLHQRRESGVLTLRYATHELKFGLTNGELVDGGEYGSRSDLVGTFSWSHGKYSFDPSAVKGETTPILLLIAEGCRDHVRQRSITEAMSPIMRRYPVKTNLWEERKDHLEHYDVLQRLMESCDGETNWERALSGLGAQVTDGFRAAFFALQLDLVQTIEAAGLLGVAVTYSRAVRQARQKVDQAEVEKTKAFQAAAAGTQRSALERELHANLARMRDSTPHEIFGVWEGCGRKVVQDRFYVLVKEHHPDTYGGNTSGNVKSLAQDIFILVKDSYQKLLAAEKDQTVPPPAGHPLAAAAAEPPAAPPEARKRADTPRPDVAMRTQFDRDKAPVTDVRKKLATMSGFRKKQKARKRLASVAGREADDSEPDSMEDVDAAEGAPQAPPEPEPDPATVEEEQRQAKLDHLLRRAQKVGHPDAPNPAKEFFNKGYHAYREDRKADAYQAFTKAYELDPEDGSYMTFYAYTAFLMDPQKKELAEELLRKALQTGNRQAAPDACLFLGYVLKARGEMDEAHKFFKRAHMLNPASREAERELRLAEKRQAGSQKSDPGSLFKNLFKK